MVKKADVYTQEFMNVFKEKIGIFSQEPKDAFRDTIIFICQRLIEEVKEIMLMRKATSDTAFEAVIKEQDQKWKAIVRRLDPVLLATHPTLTAAPNPKAFRQIWETFKVDMLKNH